MNPTLFQIGVAIFMVAVNAALIVGFSKYMVSTSGRRVMRMLARAGVDPEVAGHDDSEAIMQAVRSRCRRCRSEGLCDRWFAGKVEGDNSLCPNAQIFCILGGTTPRIAA